MSSQKKCTLSWRIQNFSMCAHKSGECLQTPIFVVEELMCSEWQLELYPHSSKKEGMLSCYLRCKSVGQCPNGFQIQFSFTILSSDIKNQVKQDVQTVTVNRVGDYGIPLYVPREQIFSNTDAYLTNDTFALEFSLWGMPNDSSCKQPPLADKLKMELFAAAVRDDIQDCNDFSVITRVDVQRKTVNWTIRRISSLSPYQRLTIAVRSWLKDEPTFFITFYKSINDPAVGIEIRSAMRKRIFVKCQISVLHAQNADDVLLEDQHLFLKDGHDEEVWKFPSFIQLNKLQENKYFNKTCDMLHLCFKMSYSQLKFLQHVEKDSIQHYGCCTDISQPIEEFVRMYRDGVLSDVTILVGDQEFKVHRNILKARSSVFGAMFDSDMKEKQTGIVDITDVDPETMDKMLAFMYTGSVEDMPADNALKLYLIADKYEVHLLKFKCLCVLLSVISVANVCEVLTVADLCNDEDLRDASENFVLANSVQVFASQEWKNWMKTNPTLAAKVMHKVLTN